MIQIGDTNVTIFRQNDISSAVSTIVVRGATGVFSSVMHAFVGGRGRFGGWLPLPGPKRPSLVVFR
jgi:hypothetical protein